MKSYTHKDVRKLSPGVYPIDYTYFNKNYRGFLYCWGNQPTFMVYCPDYDGLNKYWYCLGMANAFPDTQFLTGNHYKYSYGVSYTTAILNVGKLKILSFVDIWELKRNGQI